MNSIKSVKTSLLSLMFFLPLVVTAQMNQNGRTLYGNEWMDPAKTYHRFFVSENGLYRIDFAKLRELGYTSEDIANVQLWNFGKQIPVFAGEGFIEFVGNRNTIGLDTFLYENWQKDLLNPDYSLITDDNAYYLTIAQQGEPMLRYQKVITPNSSNLPKMESFQYDLKINLVTTFYKPEIAQLKYSNFMSSEGYTGGLRNDFSRTIAIPFRASTGDVSLFFTASTNSGFKQFYDVSFNGKVIKTDSVGFLTTNKNLTELSLTDLQDNNTLRVKGQNSILLLGMSHISMKYPRLMNMSGITYTHIRNTENQPRIVEFIQIPDQVMYLYDVQNQKVVQADATNKKFIIDANGTFIYSTKVENITAIEKVSTFSLPSQLSYLIISGKKMTKTPRGQEGLDRYKAYRSTSRGGGFVAEVVYAEDIYDHFGYGIPNHPHTFKNFAHFLKANYPSLEYVLLAGKGREYHTIRTKAQLNQSSNQTFFLPTYGNSPSDILLFSEGNQPVPFFALGRIAAKHGDDINNYLDKVIEHDLAKEAPQTLDKMWLKNVIHLGGGANNGEQSAIRRFLEQMGDTLVNSQFGARINPFYKTTNAAVQSANVEGLKKEIDNGVAVLTFFGHASVGTFDYSLDVPSAYNNSGRYPFIFSLGCYSGNIHTTATGISEDYIFAKGKGAIGFIAAAGTATLYSQGIYGVDYYNKMGNDFYGKSIGQMLNLIVEEKKDVRSIDPFTFYQQLTLNGDPAIRITSFEKPDLELQTNSIRILPEDVSLDLDSFEIEFDLYNIGLNVKNSVELFVEHADENQNSYFSGIYQTLIPANRSKVKLKLPVNKAKAGRNFLKINIDPANLVAELSEQNNSIQGQGYEFFIKSGDIFISYPEQNSSVSIDQQLLVIVSSSNSMSEKRNFSISIDTSVNFESPIAYKESFSNEFIEMMWKPGIKKLPETRYYIKLEYEDNGLVNKVETKTSNFLLSSRNDYYWFQKGLNDFKGNETDLRISSNLRFRKGLRSLKIDNGFTQGAGVTVGVSVDFSSYAASIRPWSFMSEGVAIAIADTLSGFFVRNNGGDFGSIASTAQASNFCFGFNTKTPEDRKKVIDFLQNHVPDGFVVLFMTILSNPNSLINIKEWESDTLLYGTSIGKVLTNQGALQFDRVKESGPLFYTFVFQKDRTVLAEGISDASLTPITTSASFNTEATSGYMHLPSVGPARNWNKIKLDYSPVTDNKTWLTIEDDKKTFYQKVKLAPEIDLTEFNAIKPARVNISVYDTNTTTRRPIDLKGVENYYDPVGDIFTLNQNTVKNLSDSMAKGQVLEFATPVIHTFRENLENAIIVRQLSFNDNTRKVDTFAIKSLKFLDTVHVKHYIPTENFDSDFRIFIDANPGLTIFENNIRNNTSIKSVSLLKDNINPTVEAYYESSIPFTNGSIIPSGTKIKIVLEDNNPLLKTFSGENILIQLTDQNKKTVIPLNTAAAVYNTEVKGSKILFSMEFDLKLEDGKYLLQLNGKDASGNISGTNFMDIEFEVNSVAQIRNLYNYPNPFSKSTQFVYTVTGVVPVTVVVNIYTVSGKLVKSINLTDYDLIKTGHNLSTFKYDGTDDYGNRLANGVYLFKIEATDPNGQKIPVNKTERYGKMVILN